MFLRILRLLKIGVIVSFLFIFVFISYSKAIFNPFSDLDEGHTFFTYIINLYNRDVLHGYSDGSFLADQKVTRGEFAKIVRRGLDISIEYNCQEFPDIPTKDYIFYEDIMILKCADIIHGYRDGFFRPEEVLSRGQAMKFLLRGIAYKLGKNPKIDEDTPDFLDVPKDHYFYKEIMMGYSNGVIHGYRDGLFRPDEPVNRGQIAKMVDNTFRILILGEDSNMSKRKKRSSDIVEDVDDLNSDLDDDLDDGLDDQDDGDDTGDEGDTEEVDPPIIVFDSGVIQNVPASLQVVLANDWTTDVTSISQSGLKTIGILTDDNLRIAEFQVLFDGNLDWNNAISGDSDVSLSKSFLHYSGGNSTFYDIPGVQSGSTYTLYVPENDGENGVAICPGADSLNDIGITCSGFHTLHQSSSRVSLVTHATIDYWKVSGLSGTGGEGATVKQVELNLNSDSGDVSTTQEIVISYTNSENYEVGDEIKFTWELPDGGSVSLSDCSSETVDADGDSTNDGDGSILGNIYTYTFSQATTNNTIDVCMSVEYDTAGIYTLNFSDSNDIYGSSLFYVGYANQVDLTATALSTISFNIVDIEDNVDVNICDLGLVSTQTEAPDGDITKDGQCGYGIAISTNSINGVKCYIQSDTGLSNGVFEMDEETVWAQGIEAYGLYSVVPAQTADIGDRTFDQSMTLDYTGQGIPRTDTLFVSHLNGMVKYESDDDSADDITKVKHALTVGMGTAAGGYSQEVRYTVVPNY